MARWSFKNTVLYLERQVKRHHDAVSGGSEGAVLYTAAPNNDVAAGGGTIVLTGRNLTKATAVKFGGVAAASYTIDSDTQITAVTAPKAAGNYTAEVDTALGSASVFFAFT